MADLTINEVAETICGMLSLELRNTPYNINRLSLDNYHSPTYKVYKPYETGGCDEILLTFFDDQIVIECNIWIPSTSSMFHTIGYIEYLQPHAVSEVIRIVTELAPYIGSGTCP